MRTLHATPAPPQAGLRVVISTGPDRADLIWGRFDSPVGTVIAYGAEGALWALGLVGEMAEPQVHADLSARFPGARLTEAPEALAPAIDALVRGDGEIRVHLAGTDFQMAVWRALADLRPGEVISYAVLADRIGRPSALRAVGTAVGQNPVAWVVACHRVTRTGGALGGYHWGAALKRALLAREGAVVALPALARM